MAPGNHLYPLLEAPFVNKRRMQEDRFNDRLVRVVCTLINCDLVSAKVETSDGRHLNVILTTAFTAQGDGTFKPVHFPGEYFILEGISKDNGWGLLLMARPRPIRKSDLRVINEIIEFSCDEEWLECAGKIPPDPRLDLAYVGVKPDTLKLLKSGPPSPAYLESE